LSGSPQLAQSAPGSRMVPALVMTPIPSFSRLIASNFYRRRKADIANRPFSVMLTTAL
jgi:hypothetical protein